MNKYILQYVLFRLPIYDENGLSLEEIMAEFDLKDPSDEPTQEELAGCIFKHIIKK